MAIENFDTYSREELRAVAEITFNALPDNSPNPNPEQFRLNVTEAQGYAEFLLDGGSEGDSFKIGSKYQSEVVNRLALVFSQN